MTDSGGIVFKFRADATDAKAALTQMRSQLQAMGSDARAQQQQLAASFGQVRDSL
jgi:hypothetical protein